ncbi:MAG: hypothetical protein ACYC9M_01015 [Desulfobulbaceae bacterium]
MPTATRPAAAIEMAAKYICNHHCGRCPMLVVKFPCPGECGLDTLAWQCWISYFQNLADKAGEAARRSTSSQHDPAPANAA